MASLQGPVICPAVRAKQSGGAYILPLNGPVMKPKAVMRNGFLGFKGNNRCGIKLQPVSHQVRLRKCMTVRCTYSSSSDGNGSTAENFNENDGEYVNSSVMEAVEVKSGADGFMIKMRDGRNMRCVHNNPQGGHLPDYAPHPAIVLKMEDGSDLLLPIIVLEMPSMLLMAAVRNVQIARPTVYQIIKEMIDKMGYVVKLVRVTKRVHEAYFAQLYLAKAGNETERISFDLRPSDAINIAVRCKVPIQVNKYLAYSDGMKVVEASKLSAQAPLSDGLLFTELDRPNGQPCVEAKEFDLIRNMLIAAVEERYRDAAQWRDKLSQLRSKKQKWV
ncbi:hypothetical protein MKW94_012015 [Papaver nudicaule]|uniref:BFN domain-containing protein n=1 Tax=Papaver nudicaule TaxID=74823 RepID=A0AA41VKK2_PAPNU|nr:hypothetical protein [Papaver nudicaule]